MKNTSNKTRVFHFLIVFVFLFTLVGAGALVRSTIATERMARMEQESLRIQSELAVIVAKSSKLQAEAAQKKAQLELEIAEVKARPFTDYVKYEAITVQRTVSVGGGFSVASVNAILRDFDEIQWVDYIQCFVDGGWHRIGAGYASNRLNVKARPRKKSAWEWNGKLSPAAAGRDCRIVSDQKIHVEHGETKTNTFYSDLFSVSPL